FGLVRNAAACACASWICLKMNRRSPALRTKPTAEPGWPTCAWTMVLLIGLNSGARLLVSIMASMATIAQRRAEGVRRHVRILNGRGTLRGDANITTSLPTQLITLFRGNFRPARAAPRLCGTDTAGRGFRRR